MTLLEQQPFWARMAKGIAMLFGGNCEVAVHDLTNGYERTLVIIENSHVSGRHIGDGASEVALKAMASKDAPIEDRYAYLTRTKEGRILKSSTIFIRDDENVVIGLFGINFDITDLIMAQHAVGAIVDIDRPAENAHIETISTNVADLLEQLIDEADRAVGKPVAMMTKDDKTLAIQLLNDRGAFLIKKAGDKVAKHYDISKYTLYNYMDIEGNRSD